MIKNGYRQCQADHTLFIKQQDTKVTALIVYVDDIVVTGSDCEEITRLKSNLSREFEIKDLGTFKYFLGIEVARSTQGVFLYQRKYVLDQLKDSGLMGCKLCATPIETSHKLKEDDGETLLDIGRYQRLVGRLIYLSLTKPNIAYAVEVVSQFMYAPTPAHMDAAYRNLRYLKGCPRKGILYRQHDHHQVTAYTDANWARSLTDRRSTLGYCSFVWGNLVTWRSKKQTVVARSSAKAEFRSIANGIYELLWLKMLLFEIRFSINEPMSLFCDNKAAISVAHDTVQHDRTKHVKIDQHFIKDHIKSESIYIPFIQTKFQLVDVFTKGLDVARFTYMINKLGMIDIYSPT